MKSLKVPAWEFYGWKPETLSFPEGWEVSEQRMAGHSAPKLSDGEIRDRVQHPIGSPPLRELARGKRKACIVFDDMTRPTKIYQMLPAVLDELHAGGLTDDRIVFVMANGAHHGRLLVDYQKKLGREIPERHLVFNHFCYDHVVHLGETSQGTPVWVNREVMSCDLKVAVGLMVPHLGYGFGGGCKMIVPGCAGIETIKRNHGIKAGVGPGVVEGNLRRRDAEEAARMAGLDFIVNSFPNADCDTVELVAGDLVEAHRAGVRFGRRHYLTPVVEADVAVGNTYPMSNEGYKAYEILIDSVKQGGDMVFTIYSPEGCRLHGYNGRFGEDFGGEGWSPDKYVKTPWKMKRILCVTPEVSRIDEGYYGAGSVWVKTWREALRLLEESYGDSAKVAVYPTASMQISPGNAGKG